MFNRISYEFWLKYTQVTVWMLVKMLNGFIQAGYYPGVAAICDRFKDDQLNMLVGVVRQAQDRRVTKLVTKLICALVKGDAWRAVYLGNILSTATINSQSES